MCAVKLADALVAPVEKRVVSKCADTVALASRESRVSGLGCWCGIVFERVAEMHVFKVKEGMVVGWGGCGEGGLPWRCRLRLEYWGYWWRWSWGTDCLGTVEVTCVDEKRGGEKLNSLCLGTVDV